MKKIVYFILVIALLSNVCLMTGCTQNTGQTNDANGKEQQENTEESYKSTDEEEMMNEESQSIEKTEDEESAECNEVKVLPIEKKYVTRQEWNEEYDKMLVQSEYSSVTLRQDETENYPEAARVLTELSTMQNKSMEEEADNFVSIAKEEIEANSADFETYISALDVQVRRADSVAISLLSDSYSDYGFIREFRGMHGTNYDTRTGQELLLSDVIRDMNPIPEIVEKELNSHRWAGEFYSETSVNDYFQNTPEDGISWTLDYNGVTFYFADGDLAEAGNGRQSATVSFAEYPELFEEKYMSVPEAYMVRLPLDSSFFTDLDEDGTLEELNVTGFYNEGEQCYSEFGIYTDTDGHYHYEEQFSYGFNPYYIKTAEGNHYIYLFCEESEAINGQMKLVVFDVTGGGYTRVGEMNIAPAYIPTNIFVLPLNPNYMLLDNFDSLAQDAEIYAVGEQGMPKLRTEEMPEYYDVEPAGGENLDFDNLILINANEVNLADTYYGYISVNQQSGDTEYYPSITMQLSEDGTGWYEIEGEHYDVTWNCEEDGTLTLDSEIDRYLTIYREHMDGYDQIWIMMQMDENVIWLY